MMFIGTLIFLLCAVSSGVGIEVKVGGADRSNTLDTIRSRGFLGVLYTIETGSYPLTIYRIINPLADPNRLNKYPVLYGHGVLYDSSSMISRSERSRPRRPVIGQPTINYGNPVDNSNDNSLPFMLSNNNFDVWLYDSRGTNANNRNISDEVNLKTAQKFWDFSLDDGALIDLPLFIDFVLAKTNSRKLVYVGYSESTFYMFALLSTAPEYADKMASIICMAPVTYVAHIRGLTLPLLAPLGGLVPEFIHYSFVPQPAIDIVDTYLRNLCRVQSMSNLICAPLINGIGGKGSGQHAPSFFTEFFKSTSIKVIKHFLQLFVGKRFGMYDHGAAENLKKYGQPHPPAYDLSKVRSDRIILARGYSDFLSTREDQERLIKELGVKPYLDLAIPTYNHFDFVDGKDLIRNVNAPAVVATFQLMYADGPSVLKTPLSDADLNPSRLVVPIVIANDSSVGQDTEQPHQDSNPGLFKGATNFVRAIGSGRDEILKGFKTFTHLGG